MPTLSEVTEVGILAAPVDRVWAVVSATNRYAEWVDGVLEVTDHHGDATVGQTYSERNKTIGPLTTESVWTVREIEPLATRIDTGTGFEPMQEVTNIFRFRPIVVDGVESTEMTYTAQATIGLGPLGVLIDRITAPGLRKQFRQSMRNLEDLVIAEGPA